ncbi:MAG: L,D-transpeptidase family protein [bacterium]|nr:L,D-transpeptidase family protein [bacterium]
MSKQPKENQQEEENEQAPDSFSIKLDEIQDYLRQELPETDDKDNKILVYQRTILKYETLRQNANPTQKEQLDRIIQHLQKRVAILQKFQTERKEELPQSPTQSPEITWSDDKYDIYLINLQRKLPDVAADFSAEIEASLNIGSSHAENLQIKIDLYSKLITGINRVLLSETKYVEKLTEKMGHLKENSEEWKTVRKEKNVAYQRAKTAKRFMKQLAMAREGMQTSIEAYERFEKERPYIEKQLLEKIASGEIVVFKNAPYVLYVNKIESEQYIVVFKYDETKKSLALKEFNLVSTGSSKRYANKGKGKSPSMTAYLANTVNPRKGSRVHKSEFTQYYGSEQQEEDELQYKVFNEAYYNEDKGEWRFFAYFLHPTKEKEEKHFGSPASMGCTRAPRYLIRHVMDMYNRMLVREKTNNPDKAEEIDQFLARFNDPKDKGEQEVHRIMGNHFGIPIVLNDPVKDSMDTELERYEKSKENLGKMESSEKIKLYEGYLRRFLEIHKLASQTVTDVEEKLANLKGTRVPVWIKTDLKRALKLYKKYERSSKKWIDEMRKKIAIEKAPKVIDLNLVVENYEKDEEGLSNMNKDEQIALYEKYLNHFLEIQSKDIRIPYKKKASQWITFLRAKIEKTKRK